MMTINHFASKLELSKLSAYVKYVKEWFSICNLLIVFKLKNLDQAVQDFNLELQESSSCTTGC